MRRMLAVLPLLQALVLCATASSPAPSTTFTGRKFPPPGAPEDQALLRSLLVTQAALLDGRMLAIRTMKRLHQDGIEEQLARKEAAAGAPAAAAPHRDLRDRLKRAWDADRELVTRPWPVDPRIGCRAEGIELEVIMADAARPGGERRAQAAREAARACLERQSSVLRPLGAANRKLLDVDAEARSALAGASEPGAPASALPAAPPSRAAVGGPQGGAR